VDELRVSGNDDGLMLQHPRETARLASRKMSRSLAHAAPAHARTPVGEASRRCRRGFTRSAPSPARTHRIRRGDSADDALHRSHPNLVERTESGAANQPMTSDVVLPRSA
jgi:hypothetical protein